MKNQIQQEASNSEDVSFRLSPLEHIVNIILAEVPAERILFLNSLGFEGKRWPFQVRNMWGAYAYNILIIVKGTRKRFEDIRGNIRSKYRYSTPLLLTITSSSQFKKQLDQNDPTAVEYNKACVLYNASDGLRGWPESAQLTKKNHWLDRMQKDIVMYYYIGLDFLQSAEDHLKIKSFRTAALSLHQCMEYFLAAIIVMVTGYRTSVHNINELHRFATSFLPEIATILPHHHERQQRIHLIIHNAYVAKTQPIPAAELYALAAELHNINRTLQGTLFGYDL